MIKLGIDAPSTSRTAQAVQLLEGDIEIQTLWYMANRTSRRAAVNDHSLRGTRGGWGVDAELDHGSCVGPYLVAPEFNVQRAETRAHRGMLFRL